MRSGSTVSLLTLISVTLLSSVVIASNIPMQKVISQDSTLKYRLPSTKQLQLLQTLGQSPTARWNSENGTPTNIICDYRLSSKATTSSSAAAALFMNEYASLSKSAIQLPNLRKKR